MADDEPSPLLPHEEPLAPRADLWVAASFLALSLAVLVLAFRMPRFAEQGGEIYTAPGLVPTFYGVVLGILSLWLGFRALRRGALGSTQPWAREERGNSNARLALAAGLGILFVAGFIGRMPVWLAVATFVTLFVALFEWQPGIDRRTRARRLGTALVQGLVTAFLVTLVFEKLFLVRLP
jgi:putative tricarboxylic transport membrane protein